MGLNMSNHYETLGVRKDSDQKEIKDQYRFLSKKYHPDKNQGDKAAEQRFKEIANAYEVIGDPERRRLYDATGDDSRPGDAERKAGILLQQMFQSIVSKKGLSVIKDTDMISEMNHLFEIGMVEVERVITTARNSRKEVGVILDRLKHKNKDNPIALMLRGEIKTHTDMITKSKLEKKQGVLARKMLKEYKFEFAQAWKVSHRMGYGLNMGGGHIIHTTGV